MSDILGWLVDDLVGCFKDDHQYYAPEKLAEAKKIREQIDQIVRRLA